MQLCSLCLSITIFCVSAFGYVRVDLWRIKCILKIQILDSDHVYGVCNVKCFSYSILQMRLLMSHTLRQPKHFRQFKITFIFIFKYVSRFADKQIRLAFIKLIRAFTLIITHGCLFARCSTSVHFYYIEISRHSLL